MNSILKKDVQDIISDDINWEILKNSSAMITGASGMIGMYLITVMAFLNDMKDYNIKIIAVVRNPSKLPKFIFERQDVEILIHDVTEPFEYNDKIDFIIHAASPASPLIMKNMPVETIAANTLGTYNTLQLAKRNQAKRYMFISSREIYGEPYEGQEYFYEDTYGFVDQLNPRSCYSEGKKAAETMCVCFKDEYDLDVKIARLAHTYGPGMSINDGRVQADFLKNLLNGEDIVLKSEGLAVRTYTYISDAVSALFRILLDSDELVYNIGNEDCKVSIRQLAEILIDIYPEKKLRLVFDIPKGGTKGTAPYTSGIVNSKKIRKLGWNPHYDIKNGFKRTLDFLYEENLKAGFRK